MTLEHEALWAAGEVCSSAGITYRQLDHWATRGYVTPDRDSNPGTGNWRLFHFDEVQVIKIAAALVAQGMTPKTAFRSARILAAGEMLRIGAITLRLEAVA